PSEQLLGRHIFPRGSFPGPKGDLGDALSFTVLHVFPILLACLTRGSWCCLGAAWGARRFVCCPSSGDLRGRGCVRSGLGPAQSRGPARGVCCAERLPP